MDRLPLALSASVFALAMATPAHAQNFYVGLGVEKGNTSVDTHPGSLDGDITDVSVFGGVRFNAGNWVYGAEGETTLSTDDSLQFGLGGDIDRVSRLRALGGYQFGQWTLFATAGGTWVDGSPFVSGFSDGASGWNAGVGGEYSLNEHFSLRGEYIHDATDFNDGNYEWTNDALRASAIVKF